MEPLINYIHTKAALLSLKNAPRQIIPANLPLQPFSSAVAHFEVSAKPLDVFHHRAIQIRHADLETVSHGQLIRIHEQFVGKRRADLKKLKPAEFVCVFQLRRQSAPIFNQLMIVPLLGQSIVAKK